MWFDLSEFNDVTMVLLSLAIMLAAGFLVTRVTNIFKLPDVTGYILSGILIGPFVLDLIPENFISKAGFIGDIALAFVAFDVGIFLRKEVFKKSGKQSIVVTLFESIVPGLLITFAMRFLFSFSWSFSLLLGAIGTATSPASTIMTINEYNAKGEFVDILLQVVALDDVIGLILFSIASAVVSALETGGVASSQVFLPIIYNIIMLIVGLLSGLLLKKLLEPEGRSKGNRLILVIIILLFISGFSSILDISPLLAAMVFSATYINVSKDKELYDELDGFTPPIMSLFFVTSGINLDVTALLSLGIVGIIYFIVRILGKYVGAYLGGYAAGLQRSTRNYLGFALFPQAGVAIGLAFIGERMLSPELGNTLMTIILASSVLYELIGPISAKWALFQSGAVKKRQKKYTRE